MSANTIVILSDGGTFDIADDVSVVLPTSEGHDMIDDCGDAACLDNENIITNISLRTILDFFNKHHGTNL